MNGARHNEVFNNRQVDAFEGGLTRDQLKKYLESPNPFRKGIDFSEKDILNIMIFSKLGLDMAHVRAYNEMVKDVAKFIESHKTRLGIRDVAARVEIRVKIVSNGTVLVKKSHIYPTELMKNKNLKQYICFVAISSNSCETEIISIPMMVGCEWCATHGKTPQELHNVGENASMFRGFFIIESQNSVEPKHFLSHKKICHNIPITILDEFEKKGCYVTTLKTQDMDNNSMETCIYKKENVYYFDNNDFTIKYPVTKIFKQIYLLKKELEQKTENLSYETYDMFMKRVIGVSADARISQFLRFDYTENDDEPIKLPEGTVDIRTALDRLFKREDRKILYQNYGSDFAEEKYFPNVLINYVFPSVHVPTFQETKNSELERRKSILEAKAMLLMKLIINNNLTEQGIIPTTNRNDLSYKTFMTAAETIRRDITRDRGNLILTCENRLYTINKSVSKGESNVFETLPFSNNLNVISKITTTAIPRSTFSKNHQVRATHYSQTGIECLFETSSGANIGLNLHTALTTGFTTAKNNIEFLNYIVLEFLIKRKKYSLSKLFTSEVLTDKEIQIKKYLNENNVKSDELLFKYDEDLAIRLGARVVSLRYRKFLEENLKCLSFMITVFNEVNSSEMNNEDFYDETDERTREILKSRDNWLEFLKFKSELDQKKIPIEFMIPSFDSDINKRAAFWKFASSICFTKDNLVQFEKKKKKSISLNSIPFALIDQETYEELRIFLKRDVRFMDVCVTEDIFRINAGTNTVKYISSYNILADGGRTFRPLLVTEEMRKRNLLNKENFENYIRKNTKFSQYIEDGVIEMVFPNELQNFHICTDFTKATNQRYCEIDPYNIFGAILSCATSANHNPGNRITHEGSSCGGSLSMGSTNMMNNQDTTAKFLNGGQVPAVTTKSAEYFMRHIRLGTNAIMAFRVENGNVEDSFVVNNRFEKLINTEKVSTYEIVVEKDEKMGINTDGFVKISKYHAINPLTGLPNIGIFLAVDDIIFAKYRIEETPQTDADGNQIRVSQFVNRSEPVREGKDGYVQSIFKVPNEKNTIYRITVSNIKSGEVGDKFATRYSQKGVEGISVPYELMPYVIDGKLKNLRPDLIFSPLSLTSRATPGLLHEALFGLHAVEFRKQIDATSFTVSNRMVEEINNRLVEAGHKPFSIEEFYDPRTNTTYKMHIGVVHVRILKHTAYDKIKAVGHDCSIDKATKQPTGKNASKPMRISYMSVDVYSSFGAVSMTHSLTSRQSDMICVPLCSKCGMICDRYNDDPATIVDYYAAKHCTRCGERGTIKKTFMNNAAVKAQRMLLQAGLTMDFFPARD